MGRFGFEALGCFALWFLSRVRKLYHVLEFLRLVELKGQSRDRGTASVGRMDRSRFMAKMVHGFAFRHARRTRPLSPGVAIGVQTAAFYPEHTATPTKLAGACIRVPSIHAGKEITFRRQLVQQPLSEGPMRRRLCPPVSLPASLRRRKWIVSPARSIWSECRLAMSL
jgi:hypothetical protein